MRIRIIEHRGDSLDREQVVEQATGRVAQALGRFAHRIRDVAVRMRYRLNGRGKPRAACEIEVQLSDGGTLRVSSRQTGPIAAVADAVETLATSVRRDRRLGARHARHDRASVRGAIVV